MVSNIILAGLSLMLYAAMIELVFACMRDEFSDRWGISIRIVMYLGAIVVTVGSL